MNESFYYFFFVEKYKIFIYPLNTKKFCETQKNGQNTRHSSLEIYSSESYDHESMRDENNDHESHEFLSRSAY